VTILESELRAALRAEAESLRVPGRPVLDRDVVELRRRPGPRRLAAAACLALVAGGIVALAVRRVDETAPAPPVATVAPGTTTPATTTPATTTPGTTVASEPADLPSVFVGTWVKTGSVGIVSTMTVETSEDDNVEMVATDFIAVCRGVSSTMTGTGRVRADGALVFPAPVLTCDDGSQPELLTGSSLDEDLQNLTFTRDRATDILTDNFGAIWTRPGTSSTIDPASPPSAAEVTELLSGFLDARLAGDGAQRYLNGPDDDIPLLYTTSSGDPYERAEFERVPDIEWPYGFTAFTVRLFAGDTVVEQLFFTPADGRWGLEYQWDGFGTDIAPTIEDGKPVAVPQKFFDGEVTLQVAHPWISVNDIAYGRLIPEGPGVKPTTDGGERIDWDEFVLIADPEPVVSGCPSGASPTDAEALAESIRSNAGLETTAPVAVSVEGVEALMMEVTMAAGATGCVPEAFAGELLDLVFYRTSSYSSGNGLATGESMRLYLFDAPEGSSMKTLAIAIVAPESTFVRAVQAAAPVVASLEFHTP
jgi:hypothetical protein